MDADKTERRRVCARAGPLLCRYWRQNFAALKDWQEERLDPILNAFARYSSVPIINLESAMHHPCQALADMMTIHERLGPWRASC